MLNLSELVVFYIENTFHEVKRKTIYSSFALLEMFNVQFYEDKYVDLLSRSDTIDGSTKMDSFTMLLTKDLYDIVDQHGVTLDESITVSQLNQIVNFLYLIQNLESYEEVSYVLHSNNTPRMILVNLIEKLTPLTLVETLEVVVSVEPSLIEAMKNLAESRSPSEQEVLVDLEHRKFVNAFFDFTGKTPCLGMELYEQGFTSLTLPELWSIIPKSIEDHVDEVIKTNVPQATLDVLSLLVITKDDYTNLLEKFTRNVEYISKKSENVTRLSNTLKYMLTDFNQFMEMFRQKEKLHVNEA